MSTSTDDVKIVAALLADEDKFKKKRKENFGYIPLMK
jgi:hypothetical protein